MRGLPNFSVGVRISDEESAQTFMRGLPNFSVGSAILYEESARTFLNKVMSNRIMGIPWRPPTYPKPYDILRVVQSF